MSKATYHIKETKNTRSFSYSGDLAEAIKKAEKDLEAEKNNKDMQHWEWLYKKASRSRCRRGAARLRKAAGRDRKGDRESRAQAGRGRGKGKGGRNRSPARKGYA